MDMNVPPSILSFSVPIQSLDSSDKSLDFLMSISQRLSMECEDVINSFLMRGVPCKISVPYFFNCAYVESTRNFRLRFAVIEVPYESYSDCVILSLKLKALRRPKTEWNFVIGFPPVSYLGLTSSVERVLKSLQSFPCLKGVEFPEHTYSENKGYEDVVYYNRTEDFTRMNRSAWRSKHKIKPLQNLVSFVPETDLTPHTEQQLEFILDSWISTKHRQYSKDGILSFMDKFSRNNDIRLVSLMKKHSSIFLSTFYYKEFLIGYSISNLTPFMDGIAMDIISMKQLTVDYTTLSTYTGEDTDDLRDIYRYLGTYTLYCLHKYAFEDLKVISLCNPSDRHIPGLRSFKLNHYKHQVYFNLYSTASYLQKIQRGTNILIQHPT